jgi:hypothetical protein
MIYTIYHPRHAEAKQHSIASLARHRPTAGVIGCVNAGVCVWVSFADVRRGLLIYF